MRTFVAIDIPAEIRQRISQLIEELKPTTNRVRWARPEGLHVTLKFLGEVPPEKVEEVKSRLTAVHLAAPFGVQVEGAGYFPSEHSPRVIWLGLHGAEPLTELANGVENALIPLGFSKEDRPFSAHLTLGRLRTPDQIFAVKEILRRREPLNLGSFTPDEFFLYESRLSPEGSRYHKLARFPVTEPGS